MAYWVFVVLVLLTIVTALSWPRYRLHKVLKQPFPDAWTDILKKNIAIYPMLPVPLKGQLRQLIKQFLHEKHFSAANGLVISDEIRVTIAAEACMLLLNRKTRVYPSLHYIIVYPSAFIAKHSQMDSAGVVHPDAKGLLGESWANGKVILAWDNVLHGSRNFNDGQNVVLHEFAHQLDSDSGSTNGAPALSGKNCIRTWASTLSAEFESLQKEAWKGQKSLLDHYGATNPAEFFAVATETFFEKPRQMEKYHYELFQVLKCYYQVDPGEWKRESDALKAAD